MKTAIAGDIDGAKKQIYICQKEKISKHVRYEQNRIEQTREFFEGEKQSPLRKLLRF